MTQENLDAIRQIVKEEIQQLIKEELAELFKDVRGPEGCWTLDGHGHTMLGSQWICER